MTIFNVVENNNPLFQSVMFDGTQEHAIQIISLINNANLDSYNHEPLQNEVFNGDFQAASFEILGKVVNPSDYLILKDFKPIKVVTNDEYMKNYIRHHSTETSVYGKSCSLYFRTQALQEEIEQAFKDQNLTDDQKGSLSRAFYFFKGAKNYISQIGSETDS